MGSNIFKRKQICCLRLCLIFSAAMKKRKKRPNLKIACALCIQLSLLPYAVVRHCGLYFSSSLYFSEIKASHVALVRAQHKQVKKMQK